VVALSSPPDSSTTAGRDVEASGIAAL